MARIRRHEQRRKEAKCTDSGRRGSGTTATRTREAPAGGGNASPPHARRLLSQSRDKAEVSVSSPECVTKCRGSSCHLPTPQNPFLPLVWMMPARTMYTRAQIASFGRDEDRNVVQYEQLPANSATLNIGMCFRQMRAICTSFSGKVLSEGENVAISGDSGNSGCPAATAGFYLYSYVYELHQYFFGDTSLPSRCPRTAKSGCRILYSKKNTSWRILMDVLDSDLVLSDENAASSVLTLLYNLLCILPPRHRRRVVRFCARLQLPRLCASILEAHESSFMEAVRVRWCNQRTQSRCFSENCCSNESELQDVHCFTFQNIPLNSLGLMHVFEAASLLMGLCGSVSGKVLVAVRRLRLFTPLLRSSRLLFVAVQQMLSSLNCSNEESTASQSSSPLRNSVRHQVVSSSGCVSVICSALLHMFVSIHQLLACTSITEFICLQGITLSIQVGWMVRNHFQGPASQLAAHTAPLGNCLEALGLWSVVLLSRLCCRTKRFQRGLELARQQRAVDMLVAFSTLPARDGELMLSSLSVLHALTEVDTGCYEQLCDESGTLAALVSGAVATSETMRYPASHWHKLFLVLYKLCGVVALPGEVCHLQCAEQHSPTVRVVPLLPLLPQHQLQQRGDQDDSVANAYLASGSKATSEAREPLSVDTNPSSFSPELATDRYARGCSAYPNTSFPAYSEAVPSTSTFVGPEELPWNFFDDGLPLFHELDSHVHLPFWEICNTDQGCDPPLVDSQELLLQPCQESQTRVMKRMLGRLVAYPRFSDRIIYERPPLTMVVPRDATCAGDSELGEPESTLKGASSLIPEGVTDFLKFRSNFESGNLQRAVAVDRTEYDLVLSPDSNTNCHVQWFCFSVENYKAGEIYHFNILNMEKSSSTFNEGQQPLMLFVESSGLAGDTSTTPQWKRCGHDIFYYRNNYQRPERSTTTTAAEDSCVASADDADGNKGTGAHHSSDKLRRKKIGSNKKRPTPRKVVSYCYTLSFSVRFPEKQGCVFIANCYPYTYTNLMSDIERWKLQARLIFGSSLLLSVQELCRTPGGLPVPIVTLTATEKCGVNRGDGSSSTARVDGSDPLKERRNSTLHGEAEEPKPIKERPVCIVTARVHPGESNSSWVLRGLISLMLSGRGGSHNLCSRFVWKIIPMLNPDGVVLGNHRSSIGGADLNRDYPNPNPLTNPVVYSLKRITQHIIEGEQRRVALFVDLHGHSRAKNFLMYGCTRSPRAKRKVTLRLPASIAGAAGPTSLSPLSNGQKQTTTTADLPSISAVPVERFLPILLNQLFPAFSLPQCSFVMQKSKRNTGRVVMYRQFGIRMSYTLEATMMGGLDDKVEYFREHCRQMCTRTEDGQTNQWQRRISSEGFPVPAQREISYSTHHFETMGAWLALALDLPLTSSSDTFFSYKDAVDRAWVLLVEAGASDGSQGNSTLPFGGSYALATRRERRTDQKNASREKTCSPIVPSAEFREEVLRALNLRPLPGDTLPVVCSSSLLGVISDDDSSSDDDEDDQGAMGDIEGSGEMSESGESDDDDDEDDEYEELDAEENGDDDVLLY
uniref:Putative zinc carboxypeptidase n=1 Tax=Trypanosoma congolense (strain IL3000) TaxID=1068625 RepID=G0UXL1_TRYCI|nr:putative zinc carboxypeptidase [Trypanosoma congolense IL3000]